MECDGMRRWERGREVAVFDSGYLKFTAAVAMAAAVVAVVCVLIDYCFLKVPRVLLVSLYLCVFCACLYFVVICEEVWGVNCEFLLMSCGWVVDEGRSEGGRRGKVWV